ncbi:hypothetical protein NDU88_002992 [Pleurodeles waltl]|uniref:Uncharacterized protein n=1 Tax=Pleurodeles waltl TaxID=8319 RepID=A0AAV7T422_PLEWA|nr:hypothetical protein NDU88_002992 [Pleurodeles waltl]
MPLPSDAHAEAPSDAQGGASFGQFSSRGPGTPFVQATESQESGVQRLLIACVQWSRPLPSDAYAEAPSGAQGGARVGRLSSRGPGTPFVQATESQESGVQRLLIACVQWSRPLPSDAYAEAPSGAQGGARVGRLSSRGPGTPFLQATESQESGVQRLLIACVQWSRPLPSDAYAVAPSGAQGGAPVGRLSSRVPGTPFVQATESQESGVQRLLIACVQWSRPLPSDAYAEAPSGAQGGARVGQLSSRGPGTPFVQATESQESGVQRLLIACVQWSRPLPSDAYAEAPSGAQGGARVGRLSSRGLGTPFVQATESQESGVQRLLIACVQWSRPLPSDAYAVAPSGAQGGAPIGRLSSRVPGTPFVQATESQESGVQRLLLACVQWSWPLPSGTYAVAPSGAQGGAP